MADSWKRRAQRVARDVRCRPAISSEWSGRWQNQEHARQQLQMVLPIVLLIIFVLLYFTYHSAVEAAHVLLAVPFALTGGVYLLWLLGYNFSVAVWVGFIALFGTAVQTGVVMVIYLEEAVAGKRRQLGGALTRADLRDAVVEGALLRLRPKVMTVSTVVAGLLPIMWSTRVGAEVMKPLATPVLGGMVSSLVHVLIVTPVIFFWLHERRLGLQNQHLQASPRSAFRWRPAIVALALVVPLIGALALWRDHRADSRSGAAESGGTVVHRAQSGDLADRAAVSDRRASTGAQHLHGRVPVGQWGSCRCRHRERQRKHDDAGHGDVRGTPTYVDRSPRPVSSDSGIRHGRRLAARHSVGRSGRTWFGQFRGDGAMTTVMTKQVALFALVVSLGPGAFVQAQTNLPDQHPSLSSKYVDPASGLALHDAIARALEQEPDLRSARTTVDVARGIRQQAGLKPNPMFSFSQQEETSGPDRQTRFELTWPLDLYRKDGRVGVADREIDAARFAVADRERLLAAEVRVKYGDVAAATRELAVLDELFAAASNQHALVAARVDEGAAPAARTRRAARRAAAARVGAAAAIRCRRACAHRTETGTRHGAR